MNIISDAREFNTHGPDDHAGAVTVFRLTDLLQVIRTRWRVIVGTALLAMGLTLIITLQLTPLYTARALVMLDPRKNNVVNVDAVVSALTTDNATLQDQVQILESRTLANRVLDKSALKNDPIFFPPPPRPSIWDNLGALNPKKWFSNVSTATPEELQEARRTAIVDRLIGPLNTSIVGSSRAIMIEYKDPDPARATRIVNAYADAYVEDQLQTKFEATEKANTWLSERLAQLNQQTQAADSAVAEYKVNNNITQNNLGTSVVDQQVSDLNSQLIIARSALAEQEAKYSRVSSMVRAGRSADVSQVVQSPLISQLRGQETDLIRQEAEFSSKYGAAHPKMLDLQSQKANLQAKIVEEVDRVVRTVANDVAVARDRVGSLQGSLGGLEARSGVQNRASVKLKALEANAASTRSLYDAFLSRFKETQDQSGIQTPDARILSKADIPKAPSFPNKTMIFGAAIPASLLLGFLVAMLLEYLDNGFRTTQQVEKLLNLPVLATIPEIKDKNNPGANPASLIIEKPLSSFSEAIRGIQIGLATTGKPKVVLVTSSVPGEGKTTVAVSIGRQAARNGQRVILIEGDLRHPNVAKLLGITPKEVGIVDMLRGEVPLEECMHKDPISDLYCIPAAKPATNAPDLLGSTAMENLLAAVRNSADLVIIDSAPVLPVNDTRVLAKLADAVIFVARWEKTPRDAVASAIRTLNDGGISIAGIVISRADQTRYRYYNYGYQDYGAYADYYSN